MPDKDSRERCIQFCQANWIEFASAAYRRYQREGRGALILDFQSLEAWERGEEFELSVPYVTGFDDPRIQNLIESYDPAKQLVFCVTADSEAVSRAKTGGLRALSPGEECSVWIVDPYFPENAALE